MSLTSRAERKRCDAQQRLDSPVAAQRACADSALDTVSRAATRDSPNMADANETSGSAVGIACQNVAASDAELVPTL